MNTKAVWRMALRFELIVGVVVMSYGCELNKPESQKEPSAESGRNKSYNLKFVACSPDKMVDVEIKNAQVVPVDEYVFVCSGDKVRWFTDDDNLTFTAQFDVIGGAKTNDLFESGVSSIPSKPGTASDKRGHKQVTDAETVSAKVTPYKDYSYKVIATDKNGKAVSTNDPHVIPMGNGGS